MRNAYASHTDFGFLRGVILDNPKAMPSNIDMVFERRGSFLIAEWKRKNEEISLGQKILLKALANQNKFTVLVINGLRIVNEKFIISKTPSFLCE